MSTQRSELPRCPKLTRVLQPPKEWGYCQRCGIQGELHAPKGEVKLLAWREHDDEDRPTPAAVVLCRTCTDAVIEEHPRLYSRVQEHEPMPGVMELCRDCNERAGYLCGSPDLTLNGGPGLAITHPEPAHAFVRREKGGGCRETVYVAPPTACEGRKVAT